MLGKLLTGIVVQYVNTSPIILSSVSMLCVGSLSIGLTLCSAYEHFAVAAGAYGLILASFAVFNPLILIECFGKDNLNMAFGLLMWIKMLFVLVGPPMVGAIIDFTGIYKSAFYVSGTFQLIGGHVNILVFAFQLRATK